MVRLTIMNDRYSIMENDDAKRYVYTIITDKPWLAGAITNIEEIEDGEIIFVVFANKKMLMTTDKQLPKDVKRRRGYKVFTSRFKAEEYINEKNRICFDDIRHKTYRI